MSPNAYSFVGLTAIVAGLVAVLTFAMLRFAAAARDTRRHLREGGGGDTAVLAAALQDAVAKLKAQERATAARADASERLSDEIITSLTAGLLVVGLDGGVRILNPAGRTRSFRNDGVAEAVFMLVSGNAPGQEVEFEAA